MAESDKISNSNKWIFSLCYAHTHEFQPIWFSHIYKRRALLYRDSFSDNSKILSSLSFNGFPPLLKNIRFLENILFLHHIHCLHCAVSKYNCVGSSSDGKRKRVRANDS